MAGCRARSGSAAAEEFRKAYEADPKCTLCAKNAIQYAISAHDVKAVNKAADVIAKNDSPSLVRFAAYSREHMFLVDAENRKKKDNFIQVDQQCSAWLKDHPADPDILYDDGIALAYLERDTEASARFAEFAKAVPETDARHTRALRMVDRPELGRLRLAPAFSATDIHGAPVSADALNGRVVLLDFWATWCGPCNEELPHIKRIAQAYAGKPLTIVSVSWDKNDDKWRKFVADNGMNWTQVRDPESTISTKFGVGAIPHYFTIDTDGVLQSEQLGGGSDVDGKLKKLVGEAMKHQQAPQAGRPGS